MATYFALALILLPYLSVSAQESFLTDYVVPGITITQLEKNDPTVFTISCDDSSWSVDTLLNQEVNHIPDKPSEPSIQRQIAFSGSSPLLRLGLLNPDAAKPGIAALAMPSSLTVNYLAGTCEDTGVYQCKAVYHSANQRNYSVKVSEARIPACLPGAIVTLETYINSTFLRTKVVCQVNATLVLELLSLEISVVRAGSRHLLAYINSFLNNAKLSYVNEEVQAEGQIHPTDPSASSLNVTLDVTSLGEATQHTTTCTAVFLDRTAAAKNVLSMADTKAWFQK